MVKKSDTLYDWKEDNDNELQHSEILFSDDFIIMTIRNIENAGTWKIVTRPLMDVLEN